MPNWGRAASLVLILLAVFIGYAFRQGTKVTRSGNSSEPWTGGDGSTGGDGHAETNPDKKKTPVGSGRFRSQLGGSWGLNYPRGDFGGLLKSRVNSVNSPLAYD